MYTLTKTQNPFKSLRIQRYFNGEAIKIEAHLRSMMDKAEKKLKPWMMNVALGLFIWRADTIFYCIFHSLSKLSRFDRFYFLIWSFNSAIVLRKEFKMNYERWKRLVVPGASTYEVFDFDFSLLRRESSIFQHCPRDRAIRNEVRKLIFKFSALKSQRDMQILRFVADLGRGNYSWNKHSILLPNDFQGITQ